MATIPEPNSPSRPWEYDAFLSYSTGPNYKLALKLEEFIEGFHQEKGIREHLVDLTGAERDAERAAHLRCAFRQEPLGL